MFAIAALAFAPARKRPSPQVATVADWVAGCSVVRVDGIPDRSARRPSLRLVLLTIGALVLSAPPLAPGHGVAEGTAQTPNDIGSLPIAAQGAISASLGRDDPAYRVGAVANVLRASNPQHGLVTDFGADGVRVTVGAEVLTLTLRAVGYGDALAPATQAAPVASGNQVIYERGTLREWYANGPLGLEQGFTLEAPPAVRASGRLTLAIALAGSYRPSLTADGRSLELDSASGSLRYTGLFAADFDGRELPMAIELRGREILLRVDDRSARYPIVVDPFVQTAKLTASDGAAHDIFGRSIAISGDTIVIGALPDGAGSTTNQGAAYVFVKPAEGWANSTETAKLTASDGAAQDEFGHSVAIDGDTIAVGAPGNAASAGPAGAYVFVKPAGGWETATETAKLTASDDVRSLGYSIAISGDTIVAGAPSVGDDIVAHGAAFVFVKPAGEWQNATETAKLLASDRATFDLLGTSVAIAGDTIVAGVPRDAYEATGVGSAYVFVKPIGGWEDSIEVARLDHSGEATFVGFGFSLAIAGDTIAVGAQGSYVSQSQQGATYVFVKPADGWQDGTETARLVASDAAPSYGLGESVAISGDTIVAGSPHDDPGSRVSRGAAYLFVKPAGGWANGTEAAKLTAADGAAGDLFGDSVAISGDTVVAAATGDDVWKGSAYVLTPPLPPTPCADVAPFSDVPVNHPFCAEIKWMKDRQISTGYSDGTYRPSLVVTRQAMSAFMARLAGATLTPCDDVAPFSDVPGNHPFCAEIKWMKESNISTGYTDGTYRPAVAVTRQATSAFMARLAGALPPDCAEAPFSDVAEDHPLCPEIAWMKEHEISMGYDDGSYRPFVEVTRQAMSAFLYRVSALVP